MISSEKLSDIYTKNIDGIYRFVFLRVGSEAVAQDLSSEAFASTFEYLKAGNSIEESKIRAFIYKTAKNLIYDHYRKKSRQDISLEDSSQQFVAREGSGDLDYSLNRKEEIQAVRRALSKVEGEIGDIVTLRYVQDLSIKEIAEVTGRPEGTIRVMLHRGIQDLKGICNKNGPYSS